LKPEMRQWKHKLDHICSLFRKGGPHLAQCIDEYYVNLRATAAGSEALKSVMDEADAAERKKKAAKARQAAIMADFASQQQSFITQYGNEFDGLSDDDELDEAGQRGAAGAGTGADGKGADSGQARRSLWSMPSGPCMVCQEECDGVKPYGVLALVQANRAARSAPLAEASQVVDILRLPGGLDVSMADIEADMPRSPSKAAAVSLAKGANLIRSADQLRAMDQIAAGAYGAASGLSGFPVLYHERGLAASTCGHLMHMRCFVQYCQGIESRRVQQPTRNHPENLHRKEYLCPLCKSLGNVLLPVLPQASDHDLLAVAERDPARFSAPAAAAPVEHTAAFERWLQDDWQPFGDVLSQAVEGRSGQGGAASAGGDSAATVSGTTGDDVGSGSSFPFNIAESIPRLEDLVRGTARLPTGL
ncbi:E3 ubiquitin-protein ligase ubr1, partial [Coemansia helicoidea]